MRKTNPLSWENIYEVWRLYADSVPMKIQYPLSVTELHIDYKHDEIFYGYDWLSCAEYEHRKHLIETNITSFLLFTRPTNKGTIHTLQMLMEAKDDEERAAIWLCASTKEIMDMARGSTYRYASQINGICWEFLNDRFYMWHHAMKRLVPENYITYNLLVDTEYESVDAIIDLVRMNTAFVLYEYVPILYSSLKPGETAPDISVRKVK